MEKKRNHGQKLVWREGEFHHRKYFHWYFLVFVVRLFCFKQQQIKKLFIMLKKKRKCSFSYTIRKCFPFAVFLANMGKGKGRELVFIWHQLCARHSAKYFVHMISFDPPSKAEF